MSGQRPATLAEQAAEWRDGWRAVLSAGMAIAAGPTFYLLISSLFIEPLERDFGWQRGDITLLAAIPLVGALAAPFYGSALDRFGYRRIAASSFTVIILAYFGLSRTSGAIGEVAMLMLLLGLAAPGATGLIFSRAVISWFDRGRGTAIGAMAAAITLMTALLSPLFGWLVATHGFRAGYLGMAVLAATVGLPAALVFLRERSPPRVPDPPQLTAQQRRIGALFCDGGFWLLAFALLFSNIVTGAVVTQLAPLVTARGIDSASAGFMLTLYLVANVAGRIGIGYAFDRLPAARVSALVALSAAIGAGGFLSGAPQVTLYAAAVAVGLIHGAEVDIASYFISRLFPYAMFGRALGAIQAISTLGTAIGLVAIGQSYDAFGSYDPAIAIAMMLLLASAAAFLLIAPRMARSGAAARAMESSHADPQN